MLGYSDTPEGFYNISRSQQASVAVMYLSLIASLLVATRMNNSKRKTPKQLQDERDGYYVESVDRAHQMSADAVYDDIEQSSAFWSDDNGGGRGRGRGEW